MKKPDGDLFIFSLNCEARVHTYTHTHQNKKNCNYFLKAYVGSDIILDFFSRAFRTVMSVTLTSLGRKVSSLAGERRLPYGFVNIILK